MISHEIALGDKQARGAVPRVQGNRRVGGEPPPMDGGFVAFDGKHSDQFLSSGGKCRQAKDR